MKPNESSMTSLISSFARAYHSKNDIPLIFDDYIAKDLITSQEFTDISQHMIQGAPYLHPDAAQLSNEQEILKWITQIQLAPTTLARAAYCEEVLLHEVLLGVRQYILLGAGLDTFAYRHPELEEALAIYEIDYPATQEFKKRRLEDAGYAILSHLHFIPMDFTKQFSGQPLLEAGYKQHKTFVSMLGVSYYLTKEETANLTSRMFTELPPGSSIVMDYADDTLFETKGLSNRVTNMVNMASATGEPMISGYSYAELEGMLEGCGLHIYEHLSPHAIQARFFQNRTDYLSAFEAIHYIHAVKQ